MRYPAALGIVRERVKPVRERNNRKLYRERWWQFGEGRPGMRAALVGLDRYIASVAQGKRILFTWCDAWTCPSNLTNVFAFADDYAMGVLSSFAHGAWARSRSSTLEDRVRYTPTSVFQPFPWPYLVTDQHRERVADASRRVIARRQEICAAEGFGLTKLYNLVDDGAYQDLKKLHRELDEAVATAYGWPREVAQDGDEVVRRLLVLNQEIASGVRAYAPFGSVTAAQQVMDLR
ncbi:MAG TPA: type IIL restriction-modification enzyme MmeI [Micromonosporaceae bacterium]